MIKHETSTEQTPVIKRRGRKPKPGTVSKDSYFGIKEEQAIKDYLSGELTLLGKNKLFEEVINPCLDKLVDGIMTMPKFQKILGITRQQLKEDAFHHLILQLEKFKPDRIGKSGDLVKAYSYLGTVVKNYILGIKIINDGKIAHHGGMIDIDLIGEHIPDNRRSSESFEEIRIILMEQLEKAVEAKLLNKNDLIVGNTLKYMLANWHKLEFQSKNEFIRLVSHYTQLSSPIVARSLKKYKLLAYDSSKPNLKKTKVQTKSTLASVITEAYTMVNLEQAKVFVCNYLETTKIKEEDKQDMIFGIKTSYTCQGFQQYLTNCLLRYENLGVK